MEVKLNFIDFVETSWPYKVLGESHKILMASMHTGLHLNNSSV